MSFASNIKAIRKENNLSQEQLAEKLGVSRQSVSKWESNQSYPEMDKILLICKLFNYDIGELMNENIKEVSETKQSRSKVNKVIEDFFDYITRLVDMFTAMTFKQKLKCLFEQAIIIALLALISVIIRSVVENAISSLFRFLDFEILTVISSIFGTIVLIACFAVSAAVLLHIFKIRYLDYYEIVKTEAALPDEEAVSGEPAEAESAENTEESKPKKETIFSPKQEKIVIRDPKHSGSKFLVSILNAVVFMFKLFLGFMGICFALCFILATALLVMSFLIIRSGVLFAGVFLATASVMALNFLILRLIYNFIASRKSRKNITALLLIVSLVLAGIGTGLTFIGVTQLSYSEDFATTQTEFIIPMEEDLSLLNRYPITYVEADRSDIKLTVTHAKLHDAIISYGYGNSAYIWTNLDTRVFESFREIISDVNSKQFRTYYFDDSVRDVTVYASKENIQKLMENSAAFDSHMSLVQELQNRISELEYNIILLEDQLAEKDMVIEQLEINISELELTIQQFNEQISYFE